MKMNFHSFENLIKHLHLKTKLMKNRTEEQSIFDCTVEFINCYEESERIEECHGFHSFTDYREKNIIEKITINFNGLEIDITDKLTQLELEQISESL